MSTGFPGPARSAMQDRPMPPIPVTVVTGFLGAGKTTLIRHWLAARPAHERWAVLVNEFGALGIDAALLATPDVFDVAGGCACCAAQAGARAALTRLLRAGPWQRLVVELSGLGHPGPFIDLLRQPPFDRRLHVERVVAVVDAARPAPFAAQGLHELARAQIEVADCVVVNRGASLPATELTALARRLAALPPFERTVIVAGEHGAVSPGSPGSPGSLGSLGSLGSVGGMGGGQGGRSGRSGQSGQHAGSAQPWPAVGMAAAGVSASAPAPAPSSPAAPTRAVRRVFVPSLGAWRLQQPGAGPRSVGWRWPATVSFDRRRLQAALGGDWLAATPVLRAKAVFRTERDWYAWQLDNADRIGDAAWQPTAYRRDSRFEILLNDNEVSMESGWLAAAEARLRSALAEPPEPEQTPEQVPG